METFVIQAGSDNTGVATDMVTMNSTVQLIFRNTASFFGVHVADTPVELSYSQITLASGAVSFAQNSSMILIYKYSSAYLAAFTNTVMLYNPFVLYTNTNL